MNGTNEKDKKELLSDFYKEFQPNTARHEHRKLAIFVRCVEDIETAFKSLKKSMDDNAKSSNALATKVLYLTWVLAIATGILAIIAVLNLIF